MNEVEYHQKRRSEPITADLVKGSDFLATVKEVKTYLTVALKGADYLQIGKGQEPLDHCQGR